MYKNKLFRVMILVLVFLISTSIVSQCFSQESITITTYYPAPYGVYKELRLYPNDSPTGCDDAADEGKMYYDDSDRQLRVCMDDGFGSYGWQVSGGFWTQSGNNLYSNDTNWNVGIGTATPNAKLQVNGAISRQGTSVSDATQVNLGVTSTTQNVYSTVSGGYRNTASRSFATVSGGYRNTASGNSCATVSGGFTNTASRSCATVSGGSQNTASNHFATVSGGSQNTASGQNSFAAGRRAKATGWGSFVWADFLNADYNSNGNNTFNIRASGGIYHGGGKIHDIAEFMDVLKEENIKEGEIVSLVSGDKLGKSVKAYDENLIGVITGEKTCTLHLGNTSSTSKDTERLPVSLVGKAYVKVNKQNGPVELGDAITSSSQAGIGMKASKSGKIIGYAMKECDFKDKETDEILVFVNVGYYVSESDFEKLKKVEKFENKFNLLNERIKEVIGIFIFKNEQRTLKIYITELCKSNSKGKAKNFFKTEGFSNRPIPIRSAKFNRCSIILFHIFLPFCPLSRVLHDMVTDDLTQKMQLKKRITYNSLY